MSRTYKDRPLYARAVWWQADHWGCEHATSRRWQPGRHGPRVCDLPADPDPASYNKTSRHLWRRTEWSCEWHPMWDRRRYGRGCVPRWFTNYVFHDPQRRKVREYGLRAIAEYRATGDVGTIEPDGRARNSAGWDYC